MIDEKEIQHMRDLDIDEEDIQAIIEIANEHCQRNSEEVTT